MDYTDRKKYKKINITNTIYNKIYNNIRYKLPDVQTYILNQKYNL